MTEPKPPPGSTSLDTASLDTAGPLSATVSSGVPPMRRAGVRHEVTERVTFCLPTGRALHGWVLNLSRGGLRAILEERVPLGQKLGLRLGAGEGGERSGRIVWVQAEPDGVIVGVEFLGQSGTHPSVPPPPLDAETAKR